MSADPRSAARAAVQRAPHDALAWILLAEAELDAGDARAGEAAANRALALRPGHPEALARLGRAQWMQGRREEAADSLRRASANAPAHAGIAVWLGHALEDIGAWEEAGVASSLRKANGSTAACPARTAARTCRASASRPRQSHSLRRRCSR